MKTCVRIARRDFFLMNNAKKNFFNSGLHGTMVKHPNHPFVGKVGVLNQYDDGLDFPFFVELSNYVPRKLLLNQNFYIFRTP